ncbi:bZIP transcription factor 44-like [Nicotiana tabacum]|uniref:BZIP transcription factor 44-like n=1 Tax=Nicotiana tabacum TaxID=4097 RepID=A0A1S4BP75_TOBAC|nr:bZIP transcription factor 11-like [Nicotiana tomentosiformis]XP_016490643.1 PREDICTED: bZIP transcription factor 53-like [Nicotiana tabacum]
MASSPSGTSSGSEDIQQLMDQRKRKRMISNRESARRSRMKKQKRLSDLIVQVNQLKDQNNKIVTNINMVTQVYLNVEAENSVLRAQMAELSHRLQSLNEIINCINSAATIIDDTEVNGEDDFLNPWNLLHVNQPIMASADVFMY